MTLQEVKNFINQPCFPDKADDPNYAKYRHTCGYFNVCSEASVKKPMRLFISSDDRLAEAIKFTRRGFTGRCISTEEISSWTNLEVISWDIRENLIDYNKIFSRNLKNAIKYLESGFNLNPAFLEKLKNVVKFSNNYNNNKSQIEEILGADTTWSLASRPIETSNFGKGYTEIIRNELRDAIKANRHYSSGRYYFMGRDVSISFEPDKTEKGYNCWYQREYKNCGNGDYYLALDDKHVLFIEKD